MEMNNINLISLLPERGEIKEAFKTLRTNILFSGSDIRVIAITSSGENEGKSFISLELAKSLAETGKKILLLDVDLRKSNLAAKCTRDFGLKGLSHYLSGQSDMEDIVYGTQYETLDIVFSGPFPPNPVELIGSERFSTLLAEMRTRYDYIIVDTPPVSSVIDSAIISSHCDGVIITIAENRVSTRVARTVIKQLERGGCRVIGAVLNMSSSAGRKYHKYYGTRENENSAYERPYISLNNNETK